MLKGIAACISPELLAVLHRMGHGDEVVLADAHFPGHSLGPQVLRADGITVATLLDGIMPLFELDSYAPPLVMMQVVQGDTLDPAVEADYVEVIQKHLVWRARAGANRPLCLLRARSQGLRHRDDRRDAQVRQPAAEERRYPGVTQRSAIRRKGRVRACSCRTARGSLR